MQIGDQSVGVGLNGQEDIEKGDRRFRDFIRKAQCKRKVAMVSHGMYSDAQTIVDDSVKEQWRSTFELGYDLLFDVSKRHA